VNMAWPEGKPRSRRSVIRQVLSLSSVLPGMPVMLWDTFLWLVLTSGADTYTPMKISTDACRWGAPARADRDGVFAALPSALALLVLVGSTRSGDAPDRVYIFIDNMD